MDLAKTKEPWKGSNLEKSRCIALSCETGEGLTQVTEKIEKLIQTPLGSEDVVLTSARHQQEIQKAFQNLERLQGLISAKQPFEIWAEELREAALSIGRIRGRNLPATAFEDIFMKFCIGK
jgi:tRNA modification GTPase